MISARERSGWRRKSNSILRLTASARASTSALRERRALSPSQGALSLVVDGQLTALFVDLDQAFLDGAQERLVLLFVCCDVDGLNVLAPRSGRRGGGALLQHGHLRPAPLRAALTSFCLAHIE